MANITGDSGDNTLNGTSDPDNITGNAGNDTITAGAGDSAIGNADSDLIIITDVGYDPIFPNSVTVDGGSGGNDVGTDVMDVSQLIDNGWTFTSGTVSGTAITDLADWASFATAESFGALTFTNGGGDTYTINYVQIGQLSGINGSSNGVVDGAATGETMDVGYTDGDGDEITNSDDTIDGNAGNDSISAGGGNDVAEGGDGDDTIVGGTGNDTLSGDNAATIEHELLSDFSSSAGWADAGTTGYTIANGHALFDGNNGYAIISANIPTGITSGPGASGGPQLSLDITWTDATNGGANGPLTFHIEVGGVIYASITTPSGDGTTADIEYQNGATGNLASLTEGSASTPSGYQNLVIDLPPSVPDIGLLTFQSDPFIGTADLISIDNIYLDYQSAPASGTGNDSIDGGAGDDVIDGQGGNDTLDGGADNDTITGGDGNDLVAGGAGADSLDGGAGNDTLDYSSDTTGVSVNLSTQTVSGGDATGDTVSNFENVVTGSGDDTIIGTTGGETIDGGAGDDSIDGGAGNDSLTGGTGDDTFVYNPGDGVDTITDFNAGNTGTLSDGDNTNNDFVDLSAYYDNIWELQDDYADDGILNQSNTGNVIGDETVNYGDNTSFAGGGIQFDGQTADGSSFTVENTGVVCFAEGTRIATQDGPVAIENLSVGDRVQTLDDGLRPIEWIGQRHLSRRDLAEQPDARPVLVMAGALGDHEDLMVSPLHGILLGPEHGYSEGRLARAKHLVGVIPGVRYANGRKTIRYFHLLLPKHGLICANGQLAESFYPGFEALMSLRPAAFKRLKKVLPEVGMRPPAEYYSERARPFLKRKDLEIEAKRLRQLSVDVRRAS